jgi:uncharacterized LabA/DUF88 family protein
MEDISNQKTFTNTPEG